jgi:preprotein translocase subunit SecD
MYHFSRTKVFSIILTCLIGCILALPNMLSMNHLQNLPSWFPNKTVNLGLDLRGGSHLLLEVNFQAYLEEKLSFSKDNIRKILRAQKVPYSDLIGHNKEISLTFKTKEDLLSAKSRLRSELENMDIVTSNNTLYISFSNQFLKKLKQNIIDQSIEIVRRRIDETGTKEPIIQRQGDLNILLQVPGLDSPVTLKKMLGKTAKLTFHLLDETTSVESALHGNLPIGSKLLTGDFSSNGNKKFYVIKSKPLLSGDLLEDARVSVDEFAKAKVNFKFNSLGAKKFANITKENVGKVLTIVLDDKVISDPIINEPILGGNGYISGNYTIESANELALLLRAGALPAPIEVVEERTVGPNLGTDSIKAGSKAGVISFILVFVFMALTYGTFGLIANIALMFNVILILASLSILGATLTLPGIAGIILTIGMAVDANVLFFERIREENILGKPPLVAIDKGFNQAFSTVFDSNFTTIIAGALLYLFGSGTVKGFAVTLIIGILTSMFTTISLTRLMITKWIYKTKPSKLRI